MTKNSASYQKRFTSFRELIQRAKDKYGQNNAFHIRQGSGFRSVTFDTLTGHVFDLAASLTKRGYTKGTNIAVLGENSYGWAVAYLATVVTGATIVPLDKELLPEELQNLVEQSNAKAIFCSEDFMDTFDGYDLKIPLVVMCRTEEHENHEAIEDLLSQGAILRETNPSYGQGETSDQDVAAIVFTSGTTGFSKGVMLTRANLLANVQMCYEWAPLKGVNFTVLPFNHTYEATLGLLYSMLHQGITMALNNSVKNFSQNIKMFAPENMLIVPLVAENMIRGVWATIKEQGKESKVRMAMRISRLLLKCGIDMRRKLFAPIHEAFGGKLQHIFVGGAHINSVIANDLHDFGFNIYIGYGITECSPLLGGNISHVRNRYDSCGGPAPYTQWRLDGVDSNGDGEIVVKSPSVMKGYYNNPEATDEVLRDGWFRTGDLGRKNKDGRWYITGRIKNMVVLENGKNVYPEEIEDAIYKCEPLVKEVVVYGGSGADDRETSICAEVYIDPEAQGTPADKQEKVRKSIEELNHSLAYYKRIVSLDFREKEFEKTTIRKIKRYNFNNKRK